jgi:O-antigen ligase
MKWPILIVGLIAILPLSAWLRANPGQTSKVWTLIGVLLFAVDPLHLYMAIISWPLWPGFVKGTEVSVIDLIAVAIFISLPRSKNPRPFLISSAIYFIAVVLSAFQAGVAQATMFYAWQLARMFLLYSVVARASQDEQVVFSLLKGMAVGVCFEVIAVLWQRLVLGELQTGGTFGHQNSLGLVLHFAVFPYFALLLAGRRGWLPALIPALGVLISLLTVSRATIGLSVLGYGVLLVISMMRRWTVRKVWLGLAFAISVLVLTPVALFSLSERFSQVELPDDYNERALFEFAAASILQDHPMGIGANNYVVVANMQGYNERAGIAPTTGSLGAHAHNVYLVVAVETGYFGLVAFVILLFRPLIIAFVWGWRDPKDIRGDVLIGLGVSLAVVYLHSLYEWVFVVHYLQYFFAVEAGLIVGLAKQVGYGRAPITSPAQIRHMGAA